MKKYLSVICLILVGMAVFLLRDQSYLVTNENSHTSSLPKYTVVIDAGHGGFDPGKVGVHGELEKDINLSIALKLKSFLELNECEVIMTRADENGLYSEGDSNKKSADMRKRIQIIEDTKPDIAISIHQNGFTQESSKGAQVFYHTQSEQGKILAEIIQEQMRTTLNDGNRRLAKSNNTYYMLKKSVCPLVIVECGFLSNYTESQMLCDETYQEKLAWAIHLGVMNYLYQYGDKAESN